MIMNKNLIFVAFLKIIYSKSFRTFSYLIYFALRGYYVLQIVNGVMTLLLLG
jgi:hypothetical protein